jgi:hypothetical protein
MTQLLQRAFTEITQLPEVEQDQIAQMILTELVSERRWQKAFSKSQDKLAALADEALAEFDAGETEMMDVEKL